MCRRTQAIRDYLARFFPHPQNLLLWGVIVLGAILRLKGIHWGIPTPDIPHALFHPDEEWAMSVLREMDVASFSLNPASAHREGTLSYYIFLFVSILLYIMENLRALPNAVDLYSTDYALILLSGRLTVVLFDLASVFLVYRTLKNLSDSKVAPLAGALIFCIMPFEVIHAHYLRSHTIANFFILLVIYLNSRGYRIYSEGRRYKTIGLAIGMAVASKYNSVLIFLVPLFPVMKKILISFRLNFRRINSLVRRTTHNKKIRTLLKFFLIGFFIADPFLFLRFDTALESLSVQASFAATQEFSIGMLFDMSRVWIYLQYLIPYGNLPYLWILLYASVIYLLFARKLYGISSPLMLFLFVFIYLMAKGYATPVYIRASLMLFPVLALLSGMAFGDLLQKIRSSVLKLLFSCGFGFIVVSTLVFDWAYVSGMAATDPRVQIFQYFKENQNPERPLNINIMKSPVMNSFLISPTLDILVENWTVEYNPKDSETALAGAEADYILLFSFDSGDDAATEARVKRLTSTENFSVERKFENKISTMGYAFESANFPHDLSYPFPRYTLLKNNSIED